MTPAQLKDRYLLKVILYNILVFGILAHFTDSCTSQITEVSCGVKGKIIPVCTCHAMEKKGGVEVKLSAFLTSVLCQGE
jgi:hypothetical protein